MKKITVCLIALYLVSCRQSSDNENFLFKDCPEIIKQYNLCDLYADAKWFFYLENIYCRTMIDKDTLIYFPNMLSYDVKLENFLISNDSVIFQLKYKRVEKVFDCDHRNIMIYSKNDKEITNAIYGKIINNKLEVKKFDYYCNRSEWITNYFIENWVYWVNEKQKILIGLIRDKKNQDNINPWLIQYAKYKGYIKDE